MASVFDQLFRPEQANMQGSAFEPSTPQQQMQNWNALNQREDAWRAAEGSPWKDKAPGWFGKLMAHPGTQGLLNAANFIGPGPKAGGIRAFHGTTSSKPGTEGFRQINGGNARGDAVYFNTTPETAIRYALGDVNRITPTGDGAPNIVPAEIRARLFDEGGMVPSRVLAAMAKAYNTQAKEAAAAAGRQIHKDELLSPSQFSKTHFSRAYPARGNNVLQELSYDANQQNAILKALGYQGRKAPGMEGSTGQDIAVWDKGTVFSPYTGEQLYGLAPLAAAGAAGAFSRGEE